MLKTHPVVPGIFALPEQADGFRRLIQPVTIREQCNQFDYDERGDSFTPQYELILVLRHSANSKPFFNKNAVRIPYDEEKIKMYSRDQRYKDKAARLTHLNKGKNKKHSRVCRRLARQSIARPVALLRSKLTRHPTAGVASMIRALEGLFHGK